LEVKAPILKARKALPTFCLINYYTPLKNLKIKKKYVYINKCLIIVLDQQLNTCQIVEIVNPWKNSRKRDNRMLQDQPWKFAVLVAKNIANLCARMLLIGRLV
jgi:hypothetical protein